MQIENAAERDVHIPLRIAKVDKTARTVEGIATQEVKDVHDQVVDHESMKSVLAGWPGNIREMHQPKAVGKALAVVADDEQKATIVRSYISKGAPDTWEKVLDGTLSMYSIGGKGVLKTVKGASGEEEQRIFMTKLHEISLVDNGACPTAKFAIVKMVDGEPTHVQPSDEGDRPETDAPLPEEPAQPNAVRRAALLETLAKFTAIPAAVDVRKRLDAVDEAAVEKSTYPQTYEIDLTLSAIGLLQRILAEEWWQARNATEESEASTERAQLVVLRNAIELVIAFLLSEFSAQFAEMDASESADVAMSRRAEIAKAAADAMPFTWGRVDGTGQLWVAKAGARHSKADVQMIQAMHDTAVTLGAVDCAKCVEAAAAAEKAADSAATGAAQPPAEPAPKAPEAPVQQAAGVTPEAVQTIVKAAIAEAVAAHKATSDEAIAALQKRVEELSHEPVPGGPKARATGTETPSGIPQIKQLGGSGAVDLAGLDPLVVEQFAAQLSRDAKSDDERLRIASNLLRFQHATGAGALALRQTTGRPQPIESGGSAGQ
jgi:hypothetical protein